MSYFGVMLDCSRNAVMKVEEIKNFAKILHDFGYNMIQLYTEDTYEIEEEPYFGYMRGRYTKQELKEVVEYCEKENLYRLKLEKILLFANIDFENFNLFLKLYLMLNLFFRKKHLTT